VTGPSVVRPRALRQVVAALEAGHVVAVPGDGGYQLVVRHDHPAALAALRNVTSFTEPLQTMVGRRSQAVQLAAAWSKETATVTDRMWPGPLTVIVPASGAEGAVVHIGMPAWRPLRALCRRSGPLAMAAWRGADGEPLATADEVVAHLRSGVNGVNGVNGADVALVVDGGGHGGPGPTVVDCTVSPPAVRRVGALPESYVEAALLMAARQRSWFARRARRTPSA
jgi:L-threonylcarbamoyladenylate synthase